MIKARRRPGDQAQLNSYFNLFRDRILQDLEDRTRAGDQRWARSRSLILIFKITTVDLDLLGDLDQFQIDLDLWVIVDL